MTYWGHEQLEDSSAFPVREEDFRRGSVPEHLCCNAVPNVEHRGLSPVARENLREPWRARDHAPGRFDAGAQFAQPPLRCAFVRLPRVVR